MIRRPFILFLGVVTVLVIGVVLFIQSALFADFLKGYLVSRLPPGLGIKTDFRRLSIGIFPPGISLVEPSVILDEINVAQAPAGKVSAQKIAIQFYPLQMFSGNVNISLIKIEDGRIELEIDPELLVAKEPKRKAVPKRHLEWSDLLQVRADAIRATNTWIDLKIKSDDLKQITTNARVFELSKLKGESTLGYAMELDLSDVQIQMKTGTEIPKVLTNLGVVAKVTPLGVTIDHFRLITPGLDFQAAGKVDGNVLTNKKLVAQVQMRLKGELDSLTRWLGGGKPTKSPPASGSFEFEGEASAELFALARTLKANGVFQGENLQVQGWKVDRWKAEASWSADPASLLGELDLKSAELETKPSDRISMSAGHPAKSALGGIVRVGSFKIRSDTHEPVHVPIEFEQAHLQWLGGGAPGLFPLDARLTGKAMVDIQLPRGKADWQLNTHFDFLFPKFQYDNQRTTRVSKLNRTVLTHDLRLQGGADINAKGVVVHEIKIELPHTHFLTKGKIDFKKGIDLTATGPLDLTDFDLFAEAPISGRGSLTTHVVGVDDLAIDFDFDFKENTKYINLDFGAIRGRLHLDDSAHSQLLFQNIVGQQGRTQYLGSGRMEFGGRDRLHYDIELPHGDIHDLLVVFNHLVEKVSWAPRTLQGEMHGKITVDGSSDDGDLAVVGDLQGIDWSYAGERFRTVSVQGGFDHGRYFLDRLDVVKQRGSFHGLINVTADDEMTWKLNTESFSLSDLDFFSKLDVPFRGKVNISSAGKGKIGKLVSETVVSLSEAQLRGQPFPGSELRIQSDESKVIATGRAFGDQAVLNLSYALKPGAKSRFKLKMQNFDFSPALFSLNPKIALDPQLKGMVTGGLEVEFENGDFDKANGKISLESYELAKSNAKFQLKEPLQVGIEKGTFQIKNLSLTDGENELRLVLDTRSGKLDGRVTGKLSLGLFEFIAAPISRFNGVFTTDLRIRGSLAAPDLTGDLWLQGNDLTVSGLESPLENIDSHLVVDQSIVTMQDFTADLGKGELSIDGEAEFFLDRAPRLDFRAELDGVRPKFFPFQSAKLTGELTFKGTELPYWIKGSLVCDSAYSTQNLGGDFGSSSKSSNFFPRAGTASDIGKPLVRLDIDLQAEKGILLKNKILEGEWKGKIRVINTLEAPRLLGEVDLIQGKLIFNDRVFTVTNMKVTFDNPNLIDPRFTVSANTEVNNVKVTLLVYGTADQIKIDLNSSPTLPESEILSLLALGGVSKDFQSVNRSGNRSGVNSGEAASAVLNSMDFSRNLQDKTGLNVKVDEAVNTATGSSLFKPNYNADVSASPKIVVRREIGKRMALSLGSTFGAGSVSQQELNAEYRLTPASSMIGVWKNFEQVNTGDRTTSFGLDLRLQTRFQ